ncbi:MAG: ferritin [Patescibacteria group bacterium]|jgi:ferritin
MINKKVEAAFNKQIAEEQYSAMLYLALAGYYESMNFKGFGSWLRLQYEEELAHAIKFFNFIIERGGTAELSALPKPPTKLPPPHQAFSLAYQHEQKITKLIDSLYDLALKEKDYPSQSFLKWFIDEQVEEEASTLEITEKLKMIGDKSSGILMLDHQVGKRGKKE